ncbi:tRNA (adenosine(37)-N6)-dimethylallyltransferase MiaA [bacterium]|nr:tRNA (adenosine(37)-N6)-dimethylallyltransferase MiaA [bacterium]|tara:strand:+ start:96871 stop:97788 length:918 start_codon:yes stop_codon:yes gene_type:complete
MSTKKQKIIAILGQTATGKSDLGVRLARRFNGEIISADSRQVYKGLNIGTGKITKREMRGIPHHLLDVASPKRIYTVAKYKKDAEKIIRHIVRKGKIPIIVGGTGFYIDTLLGDITLPNIPPDKKLRAQLEKKTTSILLKQLEKLDPTRAQNIDVKNRRRIIRAIEIAKAKTSRKLTQTNAEKDKQLKYDVLKIGIKIPDEILKQKITMRLFAQIRQGMIAEVRKLHRKGLSWKKMEGLGLEYRYLSRYLRGKINKQEMRKQLNSATWQYARRQKTWFKRDKNIHWIKPNEYQKIEKELQKFLGK